MSRRRSPWCRTTPAPRWRRSGPWPVNGLTQAPGDPSQCDLSGPDLSAAASPTRPLTGAGLLVTNFSEVGLADAKFNGAVLNGRAGRAQSFPKMRRFQEDGRETWSGLTKASRHRAWGCFTTRRVITLAGDSELATAIRCAG